MRETGKVDKWKSTSRTLTLYDCTWSIARIEASLSHLRNSKEVSRTGRCWLHGRMGAAGS